MKSDPSGLCLEDGCVGEAAGIGALVGFVGGGGFQYYSDVKANIEQNGLSAKAFVSNLSSPRQYAVSAGKGAVLGAATVAASAAELGVAAVGAISGTVTAVGEYVGNKVMGQKIDVRAMAQNSVFNAVTAGAFEFLPGVPGRMPNLFSKSFFTGSHTKNFFAQEFIGDSAQQMYSTATTLVTRPIQNAIKSITQTKQSTVNKNKSNNNKQGQ
jgi:hypothetical protein